MSDAPLLTPLVDERFTEFHSTDCNATVRSELERIVRHGSDLDCYKINVPRLASICGVPVRDTLRATLFATRLGILDLNYDTYCPSCRGNTEYANHLMGLGHRGHCNLCLIDFQKNFLEQVEVTFTVNGNLRTLDVTDFSERDFEGKVQYFKQIVEREGRTPQLSEWFQPGEHKTMRGEILEVGAYDCYLASHNGRGATIAVDGEAADEEQALAFTVSASGDVEPKFATVRPGALAVTIDYQFAQSWPVLTMTQGLPPNWLSAAYVTSQQDFRDLFAGEFLAPGISFAIRNTTLMFTDIKQSTELFEELGDSAAYALVQDHFQVMTDVIRRWEGGIVKTIGDAVMAAFPVNRNAVAAACEIQKAFLEAPIQNRFIEVKIGLHRGAAIAVTSNRSLDYFGRNVNIAARVQSKSAAKQVLLSDAVLDDPQVRALLSEQNLSPHSFTTELKGLEDSFQLHAIDRPAQSGEREQPRS